MKHILNQQRTTCSFQNICRIQARSTVLQSSTVLIVSGSSSTSTQFYKTTRAALSSESPVTSERVIPPLQAITNGLSTSLIDREAVTCSRRLYSIVQVYGKQSGVSLINKKRALRRCLSGVCRNDSPTHDTTMQDVSGPTTSARGHPVATAGIITDLPGAISTVPEPNASPVIGIPKSLRLDKASRAREYGCTVLHSNLQRSPCSSAGDD